MNNKYKLSVLLTLTLITGAAYAADITDIMVRQRWPWSRKVDIDYVLECTKGGEYDIQITAYNGDAPLSLPVESLSGDIYAVRDGVRRITWDPVVTPYTEEGGLTNFRVELTLTPVPLYMIVDLTKAAGDQGQVEYVYEDDLTNNIGNWGNWERNPVTNDGSVIESVIWTGVTNGNLYRTDKVVLRRIKAGSYDMGEGKGAQNVTLTKGFYIGIYQLTQAQWTNISSGSLSAYYTDPASRYFRPMEQVNYQDLRGNTLGTNWPGVDGKGDYRVDTGSFMGKLRAKTGINGFDLPTDAQWEYACRAGTTTYHNDGNSAAPDDGKTVNGEVSNAFLNVLGRYKYNGGYLNGNPSPNDCGPTNGTAIVGTYCPNAWGLYDMHGNVHEWVLDWLDTTRPSGIVDPNGATTGTRRVVRGGQTQSDAKDCRSAYHGSRVLSSARHQSFGFRLALHLP